MKYISTTAMIAMALVLMQAGSSHARGVSRHAVCYAQDSSGRRFPGFGTSRGIAINAAIQSCWSLSRVPNSCIFDDCF